MSALAEITTEWLHFSAAAAADLWRTGMICLPPSWLVSPQHDQYAFYEKLRDRRPVYRSAVAGGVVISRASDVEWVMSNPRFTRDVA